MTKEVIMALLINQRKPSCVSSPRSSPHNHVVIAALLSACSARSLTIEPT